MNMNPICQVDINRPECQKWMVQVYSKCRDLFKANTLPNWGLDNTPVLYVDVEAMTVVDCHRLKRELAKEVAKENDEVDDLDDLDELDDLDDFEEVENAFDPERLMGLFLVLCAIVILFVLLCRMKRRNKGLKEVEVPKPEPQEAPPAFALPFKKKRTRAANCKSWMRKSCRPFFLHNESQVRQYQARAEMEVAVHEERTRQKIAMWTKARERDAQKKRDKLQRIIDKASKT
ncbi:uncharacterized protein LOC6529802 [Drosophila yakuba]|uniref:Uncharacterized protein n=1 Tax=Drosophila yakuba TaxID=7245 RepID=B4PBI4_DROYA|nr:uncharacterized protein LOC6529802 [Drosophila yakuba]EDW90498.2 uncharacterized protein Dyak_GE12604 [Drosophila yakuba]